ncbi:MAG: CAP domain-containing protein [Lachnospiraceae bacterium]|nr:CAP domain-containing protein [Lachnospiraceae bacterium]
MRTTARLQNIVLLILAILVIFTLFHVETFRSDAASTAVTVQEVFDELNEVRESYGYDALDWDNSLYDCAAVRSVELKSLFSHTRPDGRSWYTVNKNVMYGENLYRSTRNRNAEGIVSRWMASPSHRDLILDGEYETVGIAGYQENGVNYWVMEFGF